MDRAASPVLIDPTLLVRGHYYVIGMATHTGLPGAGTFDFRTVQFPSGTATINTTMFRILN